MVATEHIAKEFNIGNTRVKICDDYCRTKTPQEVDAILKRIAERAFKPLTYAATETEKTAHKKEREVKHNVTVYATT